MIVSIQDYPDSDLLFSDICIVGSGAAGLELAHQLKDDFQSIAVLEAGSEQFDWRTQTLCQFQQIGRPIRTPDYTHPFNQDTARRQQCRLRQYGGTLNSWGGKWKTLDPYDFLPKPYLKESGWPIAYSDLYPYYASVAKDYDLIDLLWFNANPSQLPLTIARLPGFSPSLELMEQTPTNSKDKFQAAIERSSSIHVVLGANVVDIILSPDLARVSQLVARSLNGQEWRIKANYFVLACGSIENSRLLLSSNAQIKTGVGNKSGWAGRNLMDHPKGCAGIIHPFNPQTPWSEAYSFFDNRDKMLKIGLSINANLLKKWELPNHTIHIFPCQLPDKRIAYQVVFYLEQLPNPDSRLFLSDERDALNLPIPCLDWKFRDMDIACFKRFIEKFDLLLTINRMGRLTMNEEDYRMDFLRDASHQMGTTRMAANPIDGVVDINCKAFDVDNLYVIGSSVFPTAGNANPTFTIISLARRLAAHLKDIAKRKPA